MKKRGKYGGAILLLFMAVLASAKLIYDKSTPSQSVENALVEDIAAEGTVAANSHSNDNAAEESSAEEDTAEIPRIWSGVGKVATISNLDGLPPNMEFPVPNYIEDEELREIIYDSVIEAYGWIPERLTRYHSYSYYVPYASDRLFFTELSFKNESHPFFVALLYAAFDLKTGKIVYLNDLLDTEKLAELLMISGYAYADESYTDNMNSDGTFPQYLLNSYGFGYYYEALLRCSEPYDTEYYNFKPAFYLKGDSMYFVDVLKSIPNHNKFYVKLDDIRHILNSEYF